MASEVIAVGKDVTDVAVGDRVTSWTPHEETFITKPSSLFPTPDGVSDEDASWMCLATTTQVAVRRAQHALGEAVGVVGLGLLGQLIVQYLSLSGARMIVAIDTVDKRFEMASAHGATHTVQSDVASSQDDVLAMTGGRGLDVVYDATGHAPVLASCIGLVRRLGRIVLVGDTPNPTAQHLAPGFVSNSIAILGIHGTMTPEQSSEFNPWTRAEVTALFFDYLLQGRMRVSDLITHHHGPDDAPGVYAALTQDRFFSMGVILDWA